MRILFFGDNPGITQLVRHIPIENITGFVVANIRPQYFDAIEKLAVSLSVPFIIQPKWQSDDYTSFKTQISDLRPDIMLVNSYSMIIRDDILGMARLGGINIHSAFLPKNRGCNPIQWAIINGEYKIGVTMHEITSGVDEGPIIDQIQIPLLFEETWVDVKNRLIKLTDNLISKNLENILYGKWSSKEQINNLSTVGRRRNRNDSVFEWSDSVISIYNHIRALLPPLPPAFYINKNKEVCEMKYYKTIWEVAVMKYGEIGGKELLDEHVRIRPLLKKDVAILDQYAKQNNELNLNSILFTIPSVHKEEWIEKIICEKTDMIVFIIEDTKSKEVVGLCQFFNTNWQNRNTEIHVSILNNVFQETYYCQKAIQLLCSFGFYDLKLHRINSYLLSSDTFLKNSYKKCGFQYEGTLKDTSSLNGEWIDVTVMGLVGVK